MANTIVKAKLVRHRQTEQCATTFAYPTMAQTIGCSKKEIPTLRWGLLRYSTGYFFRHLSGTTLAKELNGYRSFRLGLAISFLLIVALMLLSLTS